MTTLANFPQELTLHVETSVDIGAPIEIAFDTLLEQLGTHNESPMGPMPMVLESWPGGRWYRDLGGDDGHLWGHVQVIKRPTLLEITGPLFMSYPAISHVRYRLVDTGSGTRLELRHQALGLFEPDHREGVTHGWQHLLDRVRTRAEAG